MLLIQSSLADVLGEKKTHPVSNLCQQFAFLFIGCILGAVEMKLCSL